MFFCMVSPEMTILCLLLIICACVFSKTALYYVCCAKLLQSCLTLCDPMDHSPPGSSVPGILQVRILE